MVNMGKRNQECSKTSRAYQHEKVWSGLWVSQWSNRFCWRNSKEAMAIQQWGRHLGLIAGGVGLLCPSRSSLDEIHLQSPLSQLPLPLMTPSLILSYRNSFPPPITNGGMKPMAACFASLKVCTVYVPQHWGPHHLQSSHSLYILL